MRAGGKRKLQYMALPYTTKKLSMTGPEQVQKHNRKAQVLYSTLGGILNQFKKMGADKTIKWDRINGTRNRNIASHHVKCSSCQVLLFLNIKPG